MSTVELRVVADSKEAYQTLLEQRVAAFQPLHQSTAGYESGFLAPAPNHTSGETGEDRHRLHNVGTESNAQGSLERTVAHKHEHSGPESEPVARTDHGHVLPGGRHALDESKDYIPWLATAANSKDFKVAGYQPFDWAPAAVLDDAHSHFPEDTLLKPGQFAIAQQRHVSQLADRARELAADLRWADIPYEADELAALKQKYGLEAVFGRLSGVDRLSDLQQAAIVTEYAADHNRLRADHQTFFTRRAEENQRIKDKIGIDYDDEHHHHEGNRWFHKHRGALSRRIDLAITNTIASPRAAKITSAAISIAGLGFALTAGCPGDDVWPTALDVGQTIADIRPHQPEQVVTGLLPNGLPRYEPEAKYTYNPLTKSWQKQMWYDPGTNTYHPEDKLEPDQILEQRSMRLTARKSIELPDGSEEDTPFYIPDAMTGIEVLNEHEDHEPATADQSQPLQSEKPPLRWQRLRQRLSDIKQSFVADTAGDQRTARVRDAQTERTRGSLRKVVAGAIGVTALSGIIAGTLLSGVTHDEGSDHAPVPFNHDHDSSAVAPPNHTRQTPRLQPRAKPPAAAFTQTTTVHYGDTQWSLSERSVRQAGCDPANQRLVWLTERVNAGLNRSTNPDEGWIYPEQQLRMLGGSAVQSLNRTLTDSAYAKSDLAAQLNNLARTDRSQTAAEADVLARIQYAYEMQPG